MNDDQRLLANAYLDGEVSADERARAEADPDVVAEVARLRAVRDALQVTGAPDPERREAAIQAALDAFELRPAATIATTPELPVAPPVSLDARRRARWLRPLAAAAVVVALIAGGVALLGGRDEASDDAAEPLVADDDELAAEETAQLEVATDQTGTEAPAATAAPGTAPTTTVPTDLTAAATEAAGDTTVILTSPAQLARFAAAARARPASTETTEASISADGAALGCPLGERVGTAVYERDGQAVAVEIFIAEGEAIAADPTTCEVVARAQLP
jgi:negative regulator of sigma E activity